MGIFLKAAAAATLLLGAQAAMAQEGPIEGGPTDCESSPDGCGNPGGPVSKPTLPNAIEYGGSYRLSSTNVDGQVYSHNGTPYLTTIGGGTGVPLGETLHTNFNSTQSIALQETNSPGAVSVSAQNTGYGFAEVGLLQSQLIVIHTGSALTAQALFASQSTGALATVSGYFTLAASGYGFSTAQASTGFGFDSDPYPLQSIFGACDPSGRFPSVTSTCGRTNYSLNAYFLTGDQFEDGDAADLIGIFGLLGNAEAGFGPFVGPGDASAYVDPTVTFSSAVNALRRSGLTTDVGGSPTTDDVSAAPEPMSWAMMVFGFGIIGTAARRRPARAIA